MLQPRHPQVPCALPSLNVVVISLVGLLPKAIAIKIVIPKNKEGENGVDYVPIPTPGGTGAGEQPLVSFKNCTGWDLVSLSNLCLVAEGGGPGDFFGVW